MMAGEPPCLYLLFFLYFFLLLTLCYLSFRSNHVISGHLDHHIRFWDTKTGELVNEITEIHTGQITSVNLSPGQFIIIIIVCSAFGLKKSLTVDIFVCLKDTVILHLHHTPES